jgi:hypothetical protein
MTWVSKGRDMVMKQGVWAAQTVIHSFELRVQHKVCMDEHLTSAWLQLRTHWELQDSLPLLQTHFVGDDRNHKRAMWFSLEKYKISSTTLWRWVNTRKKMLSTHSLLLQPKNHNSNLSKGYLRADIQSKSTHWNLYASIKYWRPQ